MVRRYHYAPQREICEGVLAVCRVDLVLRVGSAGWIVAIQSSRKGGPFGIPSTAQRVFVATLSGGGGGVTGGRFGPISTEWSCGVAECLAGPIARRLESHRLSLRGRGGGECRPPPCRLVGFGLGSLCPRRSVAGIGPRGVDGGRRSRPTRAL